MKNPSPGLINRAPTAEETRVKNFHLALGRFVATFAKVEFATHLVFQHYAKLTPAAARALLSGVRTNQTRSHLKRLFEIGFITKEEWDDISPTLDQLGEINSRRNDILHDTTI
jgi:hypothetical protein